MLGRPLPYRMVVYAEFEIPADGFRIGRAFARLPGVRVEMDRIVPTAETVVPFVWVRGADPDEVVDAAHADGAVEHIRVLHTEADDRTLYRVVWNRRFRDTIVTIADSDVALLSGRGTADRWRFELRAPSGEPLSRFHGELRSQGVPATVIRLNGAPTGQGLAESGLTGPQLEAVRLAHERDYFDEPRGTTLAALAEEVGISRQAFGGRLRRGIDTLLSETVVDPLA